MKQNRRKTGKEQYYTKQKDADRLVETVFRMCNCNCKTFIEPAGGTGVFINSLLNIGISPEKIISYDIEPLHPMVKKTNNFLSEDLGALKNCIAITNPPFGRANSLNVDFFNKLSMHCEYIAFVCPQSWRKWSVINKLNRKFHLLYDENLNINYDYVNSDKKSNSKLRTCFQIWERRETVRPTIKIPDRGYIEKTNPVSADVQLTIFGRGCGEWTRNFEKIPNTTKMFIRVHRPWVYDALRNVDFSRFYMNTAFIEALSIQEINFLLNEYADANQLN